MNFDHTHFETEHAHEDKTKTASKSPESDDEAQGGLTREELRAIVVEMIG